MQLENKFMTEYNLVYNTPEPEGEVTRENNSSGIEAIINGKRPQLNKLLNLKTKVKPLHLKTIIAIGRVGKYSAKLSGILGKKEAFFYELVQLHKRIMFNNITKENTTITNQDTMEENATANKESRSIL